VIARVLTAGDPGDVRGAAEVAAAGEGQERLDRGARESDDVAWQAALRGGLAGAVTGEVGQSVEVGLGEGKVPGLLVVQHVLAEPCVQRGQALGDFGHARLLGGAEPGAGADETKVAAFEQAARVGRQAEAVAGGVERVDAGEQAGIERDPAAVLGQPGGEIAFDLLQRLVAEAGDEVGKYVADALQQAAAALEGLDGIGEARGRRIFDDGGDFGELLLHAAFERLGDVPGADAVERRDAEGGRPGGEEGVCAHPAVVPKRRGGVKVPQRRAPAIVALSVGGKAG
jgi:hypothetical protein